MALAVFCRWPAPSLSSRAAAALAAMERGRAASSAAAGAAARVVDLRSDTVTVPTAGMREAMVSAAVGDDVWGEDPTVKRLEEEIARLTGKDAGLFVPSGTMGNLVSLAATCARGDEIILGHKQHIFKYEGGGASALLGVAFHTLRNEDDGTMDLREVEAAIRPDDPHYPRTRAVCLENTHNSVGGRVLPAEHVDAVGELCRRHGLVCHLDGARVFHAAVAAGVMVERLTRAVDTASICLSKGLGCPVGSVVVGDDAFVRRAARARKMVGGGMRQSGILAAAGLYALEHHVPRLHEDHANARRFAEGLARVAGVDADPSVVDTNIVFFGVERSRFCGNSEGFVAAMESRGVLLGTYSEASGDTVRAVIHQDVSTEDVDYAVDAVDREVRGVA